MDQQVSNQNPTTDPMPSQPPTVTESVIGLAGAIGISLIITYITAYPITLLLFKLTGDGDPGLGGLAIMFYVVILEFITLTLIIFYSMLRKSSAPQRASKLLKGVSIFIGAVIGIGVFFYIVITIGTKVFDALGI